MPAKLLKLLLSILLGVSLSACRSGQNENSPAAVESPAETSPEKKTIGMWFSYLEYRSMCSGMSEEEFRVFVDTAVQNMQDLGINTLYLHAVAFTDAFYDSAIYPRTAVLGEIAYDPFAIFSMRAKDAGMQVHAWINPMRSVTVEEAGSLPEDFVIRKWIESNDERVRQNGDRYYLNPAYPEVRELITSIARELIEKYDIDGIHLDDYFYPYNTENNFDAYVYSLAKQENETLSLQDFRIQNTDRMIRELYEMVKQADPNLIFSVSPAGNLDNCVNLLFADPRHWVEQGTVDCLIPQIYWGFLHPIKPFEPTLQEWKTITDGFDVDLMPGLAAYVIGAPQNLSEDETVNKEWVDNDDMMARQMELSFKEGCPGVVFFSYSSFFAPDPDTLEIVENEIIHIKNVISAN